MIRFSACIEILFRELDFYDRFKAAKDAGLDAVEFWGFPGRDLSRIREECDKNELTLAAVCMGGAGEAAERFNGRKLLYRDGIEDFLDVTRQSVEAAKELNCKSLIITVGQERDDATRYEQHTNIVLSLKAAAPIIEDAGLTLVVEPLNVLCNHKGYFLPSSYEAFSILEEVGSPAVKLLYDIYHQQISEGNLIPTIRKNIDLIGHFHVADNPGRHEPGTGEINYRKVFEVIDSLGYDKFVGFEYSPTIDSAETIRNTVALAK
ncbi:MAG: hydroxypyruvate isomerase [Ruminococcaceae bacterium]|nr:hydroxypyruvate isomerase [Oscillospiraceae bacterium]